MDALIIHTAKFLGWLMLASLCVFMIWLISQQVWRLWMNAIGWKVVRDALKAFRDAHPDRFEKF